MKPAKYKTQIIGELEGLTCPSARNRLCPPQQKEHSSIFYGVVVVSWLRIKCSFPFAHAKMSNINSISAVRPPKIGVQDRNYCWPPFQHLLPHSYEFVDTPIWLSIIWREYRDMRIQEINIIILFLQRRITWTRYQEMNTWSNWQKRMIYRWNSMQQSLIRCHRCILSLTSMSFEIVNPFLLSRFLQQIL